MKNQKIINKIILATVIAITTMTFAGCNKAKTNDNGFCVDSKTAAKMAEKKNHNILVVATMEGEDQYSTEFVNNVLNNENFKEEISSKFIVLHLDFSMDAYEKTIVKNGVTKEEKKEAEKNADIMQENTIFASKLNLQTPPSIYILSKDMFFITELDYETDQITNYDSFKALLESQQPVIDEFNEQVKIAFSGKGNEKLGAINNIFEATDLPYRVFLTDLIDEFIATDKNNQSGLLSKYLIAKADIESAGYFNEGQVEKAVNVYVKAAKDLRLSPEDRQNCYYLAAYIMAAAQSTDINTIMEYLNTAVEVCPEGEDVPAIMEVINKFNQEFNLE